MRRRRDGRLGSVGWRPFGRPREHLDRQHDGRIHGPRYRQRTGPGRPGSHDRDAWRELPPHPSRRDTRPLARHLRGLGAPCRGGPAGPALSGPKDPAVAAGSHRSNGRRGAGRSWVRTSPLPAKKPIARAVPPPGAAPDSSHPPASRRGPYRSTGSRPRRRRPGCTSARGGGSAAGGTDDSRHPPGRHPPPLRSPPGRAITLDAPLWSGVSPSPRSRSGARTCRRAAVADCRAEGS